MLDKKIRFVYRSGLALFSILVVCGCNVTADGAAKGSGHLVPDDYFGLHIHNADKDGNWPTIAFDSWRLWDAYVSWPHVQPDKLRWDVRKLDKFVKRSEESDIALVLPLGLSPTWASARPEEASAYHRPGWAAEPADIEYWRTYVRTIMQRYKGRIRDYEIWNEPNLERFFSGTVDDMVRLTCEAYNIARSIDTGIRIISPAATRMDSGTRWLESFLRNGGGDCIDIVGFHFYVNAHDEPEKILHYTSKVKKIMERFNIKSKPLWNTETGWYFAHKEGGPDIRYRVLDIDESANYLMRAFILSASTGINRFYWYSWNSRKMGSLIEPGSKKLKKAAYAFATVRRWLKGLRIYPCQKKANVWSCEFETKTGQSGVIAWTTGGLKHLSNADVRAVSADVFDGRKSVRQHVTDDNMLRVTETPRLFIRQASQSGK